MPRYLQSAFHVDRTPAIFFRILLLRHDEANLEMMWPSHTPKPRLDSLFSARGRYFSRQICALRKTTLAAPPHMQWYLFVGA